MRNASAFTRDFPTSHSPSVLRSGLLDGSDLCLRGEVCFTSATRNDMIATCLMAAFTALMLCFVTSIAEELLVPKTKKGRSRDAVGKPKPPAD